MGLQTLYEGIRNFWKDSGADSRIKDLKKQLEKGQEDIYKIEKERDEFSVKVEELEKTLEESTTRESELQILADQARKWKDEVDILRETADKVDKYEATIGKQAENKAPKNVELIHP